jgi:Type IV secretory pathway, VirB3-like protein.
MAKDSVPWQELPFYLSLSEQLLLLGAPKPVLAINALVAFLFIVNLNFYWIIPINILVHFGCIYLARNDQQFFDCLRAYIPKKDYYST